MEEIFIKTTKEEVRDLKEIINTFSEYFDDTFNLDSFKIKLDEIKEQA